MNGKRAGRLAAASVAAVAALSGLLPGVAYAGGGAGAAGGGGTLPGDMVQQWAYRDDNDGGFGGYSMDSILAAFGASGVTMADAGRASARQALDEANTNCVARYNEAHPGDGTADCRVVGVGTMTGTDKRYLGLSHDSKQIWIDNWIKQVAGGTYANNGTTYGTGDPFQDQPGTSVNSLVDQYASADVSIVVIMLNKYEPVADVPPAPPEKGIEPGVSADGMTNTTVISSHTGRMGSQMTFSDRFDPHGQHYTVSNQRVFDATANHDVSGQFAFDTKDGATPAGDVAHATWRGGALPDGHTFEWSLDVTVRAPSTSRVDDRGHAHWKGMSRSTDQDASGGFEGV
ncbi:hypothetical protein GA0061078_1573 [Bifidobacterium bohemicum]|nr:hypothetical protein GA0061078_1573 [Bifidobacterium bohemicum]